MYQDRSFQEQNRKFQNQEITFENPVGKFRSQRFLADLKIVSKRTKFDYFFCPLIDLLRHSAIFNWVVQVILRLLFFPESTNEFSTDMLGLTFISIITSGPLFPLVFLIENYDEI